VHIGKGGGKKGKIYRQGFSVSRSEEGGYSNIGAGFFAKGREGVGDRCLVYHFVMRKRLEGEKLRGSVCPGGGEGGRRTRRQKEKETGGGGGGRELPIRRRIEEVILHELKETHLHLFALKGEGSFPSDESSRGRKSVSLAPVKRGMPIRHFLVGGKEKRKQADTHVKGVVGARPRRAWKKEDLVGNLWRLPTIRNRWKKRKSHLPAMIHSWGKKPKAERKKVRSSVKCQQGETILNTLDMVKKSREKEERGGGGAAHRACARKGMGVQCGKKELSEYLHQWEENAELTRRLMRGGGGGEKAGPCSRLIGNTPLQKKKRGYLVPRTSATLLKRKNSAQIVMGKRGREGERAEVGSFRMRRLEELKLGRGKTGNKSVPVTEGLTCSYRSGEKEGGRKRPLTPKKQEKRGPENGKKRRKFFGWGEIVFPCTGGGGGRHELDHSWISEKIWKLKGM